MGKQKPKVNTTQVLQWECWQCHQTNYAPGWLEQGDTVECRGCKCQCVAGDQYLDPRPQKFEGKAATFK